MTGEPAIGVGMDKRNVSAVVGPPMQIRLGDHNSFEAKYRQGSELLGYRATWVAYTEDGDRVLGWVTSVEPPDWLRRIIGQ
jgi:hypothetical protein